MDPDTPSEEEENEVPNGSQENEEEDADEDDAFNPNPPSPPQVESAKDSDDALNPNPPSPPQVESAKDSDDALNPNPPSPPQVESAKDSDDAAEVVSLIKEQLSRFSRDSLNYGTICISKVPEKYRSQNQEAYTPRLVSIGFIHHGRIELQGMQEYKLKYLYDFLHTLRLSEEDLAAHVHSEVKRVCDCYQEFYIKKVSKQSEKKILSQIILLDGIFIIVLFLKNHFPGMREKGDVIFGNPQVSNDILHDLLLFENQLPLRFLTTLFSKFVTGKVKKYLDDDAICPPSFNELAQKYFKNVGNTGKLLLSGELRHAKHLIEFLSIIHTQGKAQVVSEETRRRKSDFARCPNATELQAAGVRFQQGKETECLLNVEFDKQKGVLTMPPLNVNDSTETFFRNIVAFEQSGFHSKDITSYIIMLDNLIDTPKDVDILMKSKIIKNDFGDNHQVAHLFNNLYKEFVKDPREFRYVDQCHHLNEYSRNRVRKWHAKSVRWFTMLGRDYFGNPWSIISLVAAIILLGLTIAQTVLSALQLKQS
ncbi:OLC1v1000511C1 [Oldenlandia corymbosa var. corymbosa]|uniref:OLC1v1000511C1 n=1 Tax=Oldenlandia corymbosa var. corymbosa TaxID=529605 RepID=A0AAV1D588_OLDCO|nr:OLC1v1000511C1 [Oldenlandia corymbosa var. corymbosa]